jgi:hypothetical protein
MSVCFANLKCQPVELALNSNGMPECQKCGLALKRPQLYCIGRKCLRPNVLHLEGHTGKCSWCSRKYAVCLLDCAADSQPLRRSIAKHGYKCSKCFNPVPNSIVEHETKEEVKKEVKEPTEKFAPTRFKLIKPKYSNLEKDIVTLDLECAECWKDGMEITPWGALACSRCRIAFGPRRNRDMGRAMCRVNGCVAAKPYVNASGEARCRFCKKCLAQPTCSCGSHARPVSRSKALGYECKVCRKVMIQTEGKSVVLKKGVQFGDVSTVREFERTEASICLRKPYATETIFTEKKKLQ